ncbi:MAG: hypothetical protein K2X27_23455 [Candidatus Obscuribacterales bacterium]|nr:hypothetical protein [Candidatus Obscuribacterales bacterium]
MTPPPPRYVTESQVLQFLRKHAIGEPVSFEEVEGQIFVSGTGQFEEFLAFAKNSADKSARDLAWLVIFRCPPEPRVLQVLFEALDQSTDAGLVEASRNRIFSGFPEPLPAPPSMPGRRLDGLAFLPYLDRMRKIVDENLPLHRAFLFTLVQLQNIDEKLIPYARPYLFDPDPQVRILAVYAICSLPQHALALPDLLQDCCVVLCKSILQLTAEKQTLPWGTLQEIDAAVKSVVPLIRRIEVAADLTELAEKVAAAPILPESRAAMNEIVALIADTVAIPESMLRLLKDPATMNREAAARAIGFLGARSQRHAVICATTLLTHFKEESDPFVRANYMLAWRDVGAAAGSDIIEFLCVVLADRASFNYRECAAAALGFVANARNERVVNALKLASSDSNPRVSAVAKYSLDKLLGIAEPSTTDEFVCKQLCRQEIRNADMPRFLQPGAGFSLNYADESPEAYMDRLLDTDPVVRDDALSSFWRNRPIADIFGNTGEFLREAWKYKKQLAMFEELLDSSDAHAKIYAIAAIGFFRSEAARLAPRLLEELKKHPSKDVIAATIVCLGDKAVIDQMVEMLKEGLAVEPVINALGKQSNAYIERWLFDSSFRSVALPIIYCVSSRPDQWDAITEDMLLKILDDDSTDAMTMRYSSGPCTMTSETNMRSIAIILAFSKFKKSSLLSQRISELANSSNPLVMETARKFALAFG